MTQIPTNAIKGLEYIEFDLGASPPPIDTVGVYSVSLADDQWFPMHNPANVSLLARADASGGWATQAKTMCPESNVSLVSLAKAVTQRYWRLEISTRHTTPATGS